MRLQGVTKGYKRLLELGKKYGHNRIPDKFQAYEKLIFYQNICDMRRLVYKITKRFEKSNLKLVSQMRDAARSSKQNIREGYKKESIGEFINGIRISRGSLEELRGDVEDCFEDGLIRSEECEEIIKLIKSADYLSSRYLESLYEMERKNTWRKPGSRSKT